MIRQKVAFDTQFLDDIQRFAETLPEQVDVGIRRDIRPFVSKRVDMTLRRTPPVWRGGKRVWNSEKQRRKYFATKGFGKGIPYRRTGTLARSWTVRADYSRNIGAITITNSKKHAKYVFGPRQQVMHNITGWPYAPTIFKRISVEANERLESLWGDLFFQQYRRGRR